MTYFIRLPATPSTVRQARLFVEEALLSSDFERLDDARLLVSELVTNAVVRAVSPVELRVSSGPGAVRVEVHDESSLVPLVVDALPTAEQGRGMAIVHRTADRWGVDQKPDRGKSVWFELDA